MPFFGGGGGVSPPSASLPFILSGTEIIYDPVSAAVTQLRLGEADSAAPISQTLTVAGARGGTDVDTAGATLTISAGLGTGTGTASTIIFQTPTTGVSGSIQQVAATRLTISESAISATVPVRTPQGTESLPALTSTSDTNTGIRFGTNTIFFTINSTGSTYCCFGLQGIRGLGITSNAGIGWGSSSTDPNTTKDLFLTRGAAATLQLGAADDATPVAQTLRAQGSRGGTDTDVGGGNLTLLSGLGTGAGTVSNLIFQTPTVAASGTTQQTAATRLTLSSASASFTVPIYFTFTGSTSAPQINLQGGGASPEGFYRRGNSVNVVVQGADYFEWGTNFGVALQGGGQFLSRQVLAWNSSSSGFSGGSPDTFIGRSAAAVIQLGEADNATPVNQSLRVSGSRGGTDNDIGGADFTILSGLGTGIGTISSLIFKTPTLGVTGTAQQTAGTRLRINEKVSAYTNRVEWDKGADVASANDLTLGIDGNVFAITGTTQINAITVADWQAGSVVVLIFQDALTVKNATAGGAGTAQIFLAGSLDLNTALNTVLTLVYDGTQWQETARKVA